MLPGITPSLRASGVAAGYQISRSLRFRPSATTYLTRTPASASDQKKWTWAGWFKRTAFGVDHTLFSAWSADTDAGLLELKITNENLVLGLWSISLRRTNALYRDPSAPMFILAALDAANLTCRLEVNGVGTTYLTQTAPLNQNYVINSATPHYIGRRVIGTGPGNYVDGYVSECNFIDGQYLDSSSFGQFDPATGVWGPKAYIGAYGTNGFHLDFADNSAATAAALGADRSGMSNLLLYSDDYSQVNWGKGSGAVLNGGQPDPFGGNTAYALVVGSSSAGPSVYQQPTIAAGQKTTLAVYAKAGIRPYLNLHNGYSNGGQGVFDLSLGTLVQSNNNGTGTGTTAGIEPVDGGWYKCWVTSTYGTAGSEYLFIQSGFATTVNGEGIYISRSNWSNGNVPVEYQFTNGAAVPDKNWTPINISVTAGVTNDSLVDTPTNYGNDTGIGGEVRGNYGTLDILTPAGLAQALGTVSEGALKIAGSSTNYAQNYGNFGTNSGKWYFEYTLTARDATYYLAAGISKNDAFQTFAGTGGQSIGCVAPFNVNGSVQSFTEAGGWATAVLENVAWAQGDVVQIAYDIDAGKLWYGRNNTWYASGAPATGAFPTKTFTPAIYWRPWFLTFEPTTGGVNHLNFGQRPFVYAAPAGFKALCTQNLPEPVIKKPSQYFDINLRGGFAGPQSITGKAFSPDLVWIKNRSAAAADHAIYDSVRGVTKDIATNTTAQETTEVQGLTAFNADGFTIGTLPKINTVGNVFVDWMWKRGVVPGFDMVPWGGTGVARTLSHALGVKPAMMIIRNRSSAIDDWMVWHKSLVNPATDAVPLTTDPASSSAAYWNNTQPTAIDFSLGTHTSVNANGQVVQNYLFAEVPGFSRFGSYTGNGSTDGPFVWCGFRPRWIMVKRIDGRAENWPIHDTAREPINVMSGWLYADLPTPEDTGGAVFGDALSNGFKIRYHQNPVNTAAATYIFAAFAEAPFKYARAR